jgi:dipeptidyl aminopeptidase/acylaminoacyl peptidase
MNVRIRFAFVVLLSIVCLPAFAKTPLTVDKLLKLKRVSDPQVSPDSQWVAYTVTEMNATENNSNSDIYLMKMDGSKRLRLTQFAKADNTPRWRPDGKLLTFLSSRSGSMQIWSFPIDGSIGGEPTQLTDLAMDVDSYNWSNDGKNILFTSTVFKDCDDNACNKKKSDEEEKNKLKVRIIEDDLYRHWDGWLTDGKHSRLFRLQVADKKITALSPRGLFVPPVALEGNNDFTISPDGKEVAYVTNTDKDLSRSTNNDIFLTDLAGKPAQRLTAANLSNDNTPTYSPDGRFIAYRSQEIPGFESDRIRLKLYDRRSHTHMEVSKDAPIDNWVQEIAWGADGKNLYFTTEDQGYDSVFSYNLDEKRLTKLTEKMTINNLRSSADGKSLVFLKTSFEQPAEVFVRNLITGITRQLTFENQELLKDIELSKWEEFEYPSSADGKTIHGFLMLPPNFKSSGKYPFVLVIHGGPQGQWANVWHWRWNAQMFAAPGYVAAFINPRGSTGWGQEFTNGVSKDHGGKPYLDLMSGVDYLVKSRSYINGKAMAAAGGSYGGFMVNWLAGHTDRFNALISHAGLSDVVAMYGTTEEKWFPEWDMGGNPYENLDNYKRFSPIEFAKNFKTPMLILHGEQDYRVPLEQAQILYTAHKVMHVPVKMVLFSNESHWIGKPGHAKIWWESINDWLKRYITK